MFINRAHVLTLFSSVIFVDNAAALHLILTPLMVVKFERMGLVNLSERLCPEAADW